MKINIKCIKLLIIIFLSLKTFSTPTDSLLQNIESKSPIQQIIIYSDLSERYLNTNSDSSLMYALQGLKIAENHNFSDSTYKILQQLGYVYIAISEYEKANFYSQKLLEISITKDDLVNQANAFFNLGLSADYKGDFEIANSNYYKALAIYEKLNMQDGVAKCFTNIGIVHYFNGLYEKAIEYYQKAFNVAFKADLDDLKGNLLNNIATVFYQRDAYDSALVYYMKAVDEMAKQPSAGQKIATIYGNMGLVYEETNDFQNAEKYHYLSLEIHQKLKNQYGMATAYKDLGKMYIAQKKYSKGIEYLNNSLLISEQIGTKQIHETIYKHLANAYAGDNDYERAFHSLLNHNILKDSIINDRNRKSILEIEAKYENEKKQKEIELLKANEAKQVILNYSVSFFVILLLLFIYFIYNRLKVSKQQNSIIDFQKKVVELKNDEITQSIQYAQKIQRALLPNEQIFKHVISDLFIFFNPKDIVSGDFYWHSEREDYIFYATVDCTGHGVPGGFMSMLGTALLNEIIDERKMENCGEVLTLMREKIIQALKQEEDSESKDGMDMVLIRIDKKTLEMQYAAANNKFYIIRDGILLTQNSDKMPVGVYHSTIKPFQTFTFQLKNGDTIYTFTDGYADQFGGAGGKKLGYKAFREKLIEISNVEMDKQKEKLSSFFEDWKGSEEQIDDVCVIGVRV